MTARITEPLSRGRATRSVPWSGPRPRPSSPLRQRPVTVAPHRRAPGVADPVGRADGTLVHLDPQAGAERTPDSSLRELEHRPVHEVVQQVRALVVVNAHALLLDEK